MIDSNGESYKIDLGNVWVICDASGVCLNWMKIEFPGGFQEEVFHFATHCDNDDDKDDEWNLLSQLSIPECAVDGIFSSINLGDIFSGKMEH